MHTISKLTPEQEQRLQAVYQEWLAVGRSCEPINRPEGERIITQLYARLGKAAPAVLWFSSPAMCLLAWVELKKLSAKGAQLDSQLYSQLYSQLGSQLDSQLYSQLDSQLGSQLDSQLYSQLDSQLYSQLRSQLYSQLYSQLGSQLDSQLYSQLDSQLDSQLRSQLRSQLYSQLDSQLRSQLDSQLRSQLDSQLRSQLYSQLDSQLRSQLDSQLRSQLRSQLDSQLRSQLDSQLDSQLRSQLRSQLYSQLDSQLRSQLDSQLRSQLYSQLYSQLRSQLDSQLRSQLYSQLYSQLDSQLYSQLDSQLRSQLDSRWVGNQWCSWEAFYSFPRELGVKYSKSDSAHLDVWVAEARQLHWWFPFDGIVLASERHSLLKIDDRGRMHCECGPALAYSDGWSIYAWHGTRVEAKIIEQRGSITVTDILEEKNTEVRRVMRNLYGTERFMTDAGAKEIDRVDSHGVRLLSLRLPDDPVDIRCCELTCPSTGYKYFERVPPTIKTAAEALAWRFDIKPAEYTPDQQT